MTVALLGEGYSDKIQGVPHYYDRVVISGNLQPLCYAKGMTGYLSRQGIRIPILVDSCDDRPLTIW